MHTRPRPPAWLWANLLSLDAPVVALVWQDFLAHCYPTTLRPAGRIVLGLTVWAIYLADRLLDIRHPATGESVRHSFYRDNRLALQSLLAVVAAVDLLMTLLWLRPAVFDNGLVLTAGVVTYLATFAFTGRTTVWKKPLAALLFTAGTFLIAWTGAGHHASQLTWPALAFCALCLGNLLTVEPRVLPRNRMWLLFLCACLASAGNLHWFAAIVLSAACLWALARSGRKISREALGVLADAVLLTPLLFR